MFEKTKEKVNNYFEEHPKVKKGLKVAGGITIVAGAAFGGYKIGRRLERIEFNKLFRALAANGQLIPKAEKLPDEVPEGISIKNLSDGPIKIAVTKSPILAHNDHSFDVTFTDLTDGTKFISKDYCYGSYVNDCLDGMSYIVEEATEKAAEVAEEIAETVAETVTE